MSYKLNPFNPTTPYENQVTTELNDANENFKILGQAFYKSDPSSNPILRASYVGTSAPSNPVAGTTWLDTSSSPSILKVYDGNNWQRMAPISSNGVLDLSSGYVKSDAYSFRRINGNNLSSDYYLAVGEEAIYTFSTSSPPINVPLHITTDKYGLYLILIADYMTSPPSTDIGHYQLYSNNISYSNSFKSLFIAFNESKTNYDFYSYTKDVFYFDKFPGGVCYVLIDVYNRVAMFDNSANVETNGAEPGSRKFGTTRWTDKYTSWSSLGTMGCGSTGGMFLVRRLA
jgi:hypothetical protein